jgi:20S proteasome alpha/beta subunit
MAELNDVGCRCCRRKNTEYSFSIVQFLSSAMLMISYDEEAGPQIFRVDPAGYFR